MTTEIIITDGNQPGALATIGNKPLDQNPAAVFIGKLTSEHSRRNMARYLAQIADLLYPGRWDEPAKDAGKADKQAYKLRYLLADWSALRFAHTSFIRAELSARYAPATVNVMLSALRGVLESAFDLGLIGAEDYQRAIKIKNVSGETVPAGRDISQGEMLALVNACMTDTSAAGVRDAAIIGVLYTCGLRRAELVNLDLTDYEAESGKLIVRSGKGRKARNVYATNGTLQALNDWLDIRGAEAGALFNPVNKGGKVQRGRRMTSQAVYNMLQKRGEQSGVENFSCHDFRRTFVGDLLDRGADIVTVQKLAGHASPLTTSRYDRRPEEAKKQAAAKLHFPYKPRKKLV